MLETAERFQRSVEFWIGQNGIIFAAWLFFVLTALIIALILFTKYIPTITQEVRTRGHNLEVAVTTVARDVSELTQVLQTFVAKQLPNLIQESVGQVTGTLGNAAIQAAVGAATGAPAPRPPAPR